MSIVAPVANRPGEWPSSSSSAAARFVVDDDEFLDDFDDDDEAFFSSATSTTTTPAPPEGEESPDRPPPTTTTTSFGTVALTYDDVSPRPSSRSSYSSSARRRRRGGGDDGARVAVGRGPAAGSDECDDDDDPELLDLDRRHLSHLRDSNSPYRDVARSILAIHQLACGDGGGCRDDRAIPSSSSSSSSSLRVESSIVLDRRRSRRLARLVLPPLTTCLKSHASPKCRSLASRAMASIARSLSPRDAPNPRLDGHVVPSSSSSSSSVDDYDDLHDACARALVASAIDDDDDYASGTALASLGTLLVDVGDDDDHLAAEVRGIAECANSTNALTYSSSSSDFPMIGTTSGRGGSSSATTRATRYRIREDVVFPRLGMLMHRVSLYAEARHAAVTAPTIASVLVHAITRGRETAPTRRAMRAGKTSHGRGGWREIDAEGLAGEYVVRVLLPRLGGRRRMGVGVDDDDHGSDDGGTALAIAIALVRMSSACPHAPWRTSACRHAASVLLRRLDGMMTSPTSSSLSLASRTSTSAASAPRRSPAELSRTISSASAPIETLAGAAAALVVALRGIPPRERVPGLTATLCAALMYLPLGVPVSHGGGESPDLPVGAVREPDGRMRGHYRLGRTGLLVEVALSLMLDGAASADRVGGGETGAVLLRRVLRSDRLVPVWECSKYERESAYRPADELLWVFCSVATRVVKGPSIVDAASWCDLSLVVLDFFAGLVCDPGHRSGASPFADAGHAAYVCLFADVLQRCGSFPPSTLSVSKNMMPPSSFEAAPVDVTSPVVGGPGKQLDRVASSLTKLTTKIFFLRDRDKSRHTAAQAGVASVDDSFCITRLVAVLVDAWLGRCIMNHDTKHSNDELLDMGIMFFPLICTILLQLLNQHGASIRQESADMVSQLTQVLIASFENIACMSELLAHTSSRQAKEGVAESENVGPLAISMLRTIISSAKEGVGTPTEQGSMIRYQIAIDVQNAINRISACIRNMPQSYPEDIASSFQVSPLIANAMPKPLLSSPDQHGPMERCAWFLYNHGRLVLFHRTNMAAEALTPTASSSGVVKLVRPRNPLRLTSSFSHSTIVMYQKVNDLPLFIPAWDHRRNDTVAFTVTGCSDPVSLILTHGMQRVLRGDFTESLSFVITMRLYNITPVPIRNGVCLGVKILQKGTSGKRVMLGDGSTCAVVSPYKHEIPAGDSVTWEVTLMNWRVGELVVQTDVTFLDLEKESTTHRWLSAGGPVDDKAMPIEAIDDEEEAAMDITLPCKPITISTIDALIPCPLVFFIGCSRCVPNWGQGDVASFDYLWNCMGKWQRQLSFIIPNGQMEGNAVRTLADTKKGYVNIASSVANEVEYGKGSPVTGCAFLAPDGSRICCTHQAQGGDTHVLKVRSDSSVLLESVVGTTDLQTSFIRFIFGSNALVVDEGDRGQH